MFKIFRKKDENISEIDLDLSIIPQHVAFIMDGNGRWAKERNLPRTMGIKLV